MTLLLVGFAGFVIGVAAIIVGRSMDAKRATGQVGSGSDLLAPVVEWLVDVLRREWPILTGESGSTGKRVAAAGSLLAAVGVLAMVGGIVSAAVGG